MSDTVLTMDDVSVRMESREIVKHVSTTVSGGEVVALMGRSGAGKTTVLRAIMGLEALSGGTLDVAGVRLEPSRPLRGARLQELRRRVGMVFQFHHLFAHLTALQNVWLAPVHAYHVSRPEAEREAHRLLEALGVGSRAEALPHQLSGGEAQRVAIARALAVNPTLLLLDEPTASLDADRREDLASRLISLAAQGRTLIVATHDADFARSCARRVLWLENGCIARDSVLEPDSG